MKQLSIDPNAQKIKLKKNVILIEYKNEKYILKGKRDKEKNILEKFRFFNEIRIYSALNKGKFDHFNAPESYIEKNTGSLLLQYINIDARETIKISEFVRAYIELQRISLPDNFLFNLYNQIFSAYFYRIVVVAMVTISRKMNIKTALKCVFLYIKLSKRKKSLSQKIWVHGDLHGKNYFKDNNQNLYFIDFENMFYTTKWPLAEIISKGFLDDGDYVTFTNKFIKKYLRNLKEDSEINSNLLYLESRFALLHHSIHEIAQTRLPNKKKYFINILKITLNEKQFKEWYQKNIQSTIMLDKTF